MSDSLIYALGVLALIYFGRIFLRRILTWLVKTFWILLVLATVASAQEPEPEPEPTPRTDAENLAVIANGAEACAFGLGLLVGMYAWQILSTRSRFDL